MINEAPLAERMRPASLDDFVGQPHLVGKDGAFTRMLKARILPSLILWGPPGVGKTTLAKLLAKAYERPFLSLNAISSGVKDVREIIERAEKSGFMGQIDKPVVFIDEIHRFNKNQQDSLLAAVEKGTFTLVGATTENPSFEINSALLSRCQVFVLESLTLEHLNQVLDRALEKDTWLQEMHTRVEEREALFSLSGGDARKLLNYLEIAVSSAYDGQESRITNAGVKESVQSTMPVYDKKGEMHYDIVSAFIKSVRGSDPQAAVYWLARMLHGGENVRFIARRMLILASEDVGNANPNALLLATSCFQAVEMIGMPEARIILSQTAIYLATSPKSNASYLAINDALAEVKSSGDLSVPLHLRNAPTRLMKELNYGGDYKYDHDYPNHFSGQEFLPEAISGRTFYKPALNTRELEIRKQMISWWKEKYKLD